MENNTKIEQEKRIAEAKRREKMEKYKAISKRIALWGGVAAVLVGMVWGMSKLGTPATNNGPASALTEPVSAADNMRGNQLAKVVLVEYSDFQCPACAQFYPYIKSIEQKYSKDILLVYRHFPLPSHDKSDLAARAAEAAAAQGKFWDMHDKLFENQSTWSGNAEPEKLFTEYAVQLGLNKDKFTQDLKNPAIAAHIQKDIANGAASGLQGTPTFFLNGKMLNLQTYADLESNIAGAITESR